MILVLEIAGLLLLGGATGWMTHAFIEERYADRLPWRLHD
jgi:hypothetical protein